MRRFLLNLVGVLGVSLLVLGSLYRYADGVVDLEDYDNHFLAATIDRHARLDTLAKPRIIFVGASNLAFGIDSEYLQGELGKPVVNLGLHGALGTGYIFNEALDVAEPGDVIVFCTGHFFKYNGSKKMHYLLHKIYPKTRDWTIGVSQYDRVKFWLDDAVRTLQQAKRQGFRRIPPIVKESVYKRSSFNTSGDVVAHLEMSGAKEIPWNRKWLFDGFEEDIEQLNVFYCQAKEKGCQVYMMYPPYPQHIHDGLTNDLKTLSSFYEKIDIPILNEVEDVVYPRELFFDSVYHLNRGGRERWNGYLVELLKAKIKNQ